MKEVRLELSKDALKELMWVVKKLNVRSVSDVIRESISIVIFILKKKEKGWKLYLQKGLRKQEIITLSEKEEEI